MKKVILMAIISLIFSSCAELQQVASQPYTNTTGSKVTGAENISGLKSSLNIGIEQAVSTLGAENGFYQNA